MVDGPRHAERGAPVAPARPAELSDLPSDVLLLSAARCPAAPGRVAVFFAVSVVMGWVCYLGVYRGLWLGAALRPVGGFIGFDDQRRESVVGCFYADGHVAGRQLWLIICMVFRSSWTVFMHRPWFFCVHGTASPTGVEALQLVPPG